MRKTRTTRGLMALLVAAIVINIILVVLLLAKFSGIDITGLGTAAPSSERPDTVEINKDELVKCCSFVNKDGEEDACYVLPRFDCSHCADYCS